MTGSAWCELCHRNCAPSELRLPMGGHWRGVVVCRNCDEKLKDARGIETIEKEIENA